MLLPSFTNQINNPQIASTPQGRQCNNRKWRIVDLFDVEGVLSSLCCFKLPWLWRTCCRAWWMTTWWTVKEWVHPTTTGPFPARPCTLASTNWRSCKHRCGDFILVWKQWPHISKAARVTEQNTINTEQLVLYSIETLCRGFHENSYVLWQQKVDVNKGCCVFCFKKTLLTVVYSK